MLNIYTVYEIISLFGAGKLIKYVDPGKPFHSRYNMGLDTRKSLSLSDSSGFGKRIMTTVGDMRSFVHIDDKKKGILILGNVPAGD